MFIHSDCKGKSVAHGPEVGHLFASTGSVTAGALQQDVHLFVSGGKKNPQTRTMQRESTSKRTVCSL